MKRAMDLGHGVGQDRGAAGFVTEESIINSVGSLVIAKLKAPGHSIIEVRPQYANSVSDSLIKRVDLANSNNVDLYVSIHANAGGGKGAEVFTYRGTELDKARAVLNNLETLGFIKTDEKGNKISRGIKSSNLYVINKTEARAMLIEICFVDTKSDMELYNSIGAEKVANAIVEGLTGQVANVSETPNSSPIEAVIEKPKLSNWISKLQAECNSQGFSNQTVDGTRGVNTLNACPTLKIGAEGNITAILQARLTELGFITCGVDGQFGAYTKSAVISFQRHFGLMADGIVGKNTWSKILGM